MRAVGPYICSGLGAAFQCHKRAYWKESSGADSFFWFWRALTIATASLLAMQPALPYLLYTKPFFESAIRGTALVISPSFSNEGFNAKYLIWSKFFLDHPGLVL